ncbi:MAG: hypothetical protein A2Y13_13035 [Planctomycetes bacterium GWC2_45_44]|nr:MAG: hypothetical protein A2Y13_13035 [Planctomycetes bacterium GWC2_45_44]
MKSFNKSLLCVPLFVLCISAFFFMVCSNSEATTHIPIASVAYSSQDAVCLWSHVMDNSGVSGDTHSAADTHDAIYTDMSLTANVAPVHWVEYDLGRNYNISEMWIWNYNEYTPLGMKEVYIQYKPDGGAYGGIYDGQIPQADGSATNTVDKIIDFSGVTARYVKIWTYAFPEHNWSGGVYNCAGLSEVRFYPVSGTPEGTVVQAKRIPVASCTYSSQSTGDGYLWNHTFDNAGMSDDTTHGVNGTHGSVATTMGLSDNVGGGSHWVEYDLGQNYNISEMWIWNFNVTSATFLGMKHVYIECKPNGGSYGGVYDGIISQADGSAAHPVDKIIDFSGVTARYVKIWTYAFPEHNWSGGVYNCAGLSEVRFIGEPADFTLQNFGYYYTDTIAYGAYMERTVFPVFGQVGGTRLADYTNIMHTMIGQYGQSDLRRAIIDAANLGYKTMLYSGEFSPGSPELWPQKFAELKSYYAGYENFMFAHQLIDEPEPKGWSRAQMEDLVAAARDFFNDGVPLTMAMDNPRDANTVPRNLDFVTCHYYLETEFTTKTQYDTAMNAILSGIRDQAPGKPILIFGSSMSDGGHNGGVRPTLEQANWWYQTACNNSDVIGLLYYMLGNEIYGSTVGAIDYPNDLSLHCAMGTGIKGQTEGIIVDDRFDTYADQDSLEAVYDGHGGVCPMLTGAGAYDHGVKGAGKCVCFGAGSEMATQQVFTSNNPGSVSAFMSNFLYGEANHYFGFRAMNAAGSTIAIYAEGTSANFYVDDTANSVSGYYTNCPSLADHHWQKVEFQFDGTGVKVYADSLLVYQAAGGWSGGFSDIGFYDPCNSDGVGYIDDIMALGTTVTVTASSQHQTRQAVKVIDNSGMTGDLHDNDYSNMWVSGGSVSAPHWMQFTFDRIRPLSAMKIWNYNEPSWYTMGTKNATIQYSTDGAVWTTIYNNAIPCANGVSNHPADLTVDFAGASAKYINITTAASPNHNYTGGSYVESGLSEVRFEIPLAVSPSPSNAATNIDINADLSWTAGAGAASHDVYFGANLANVTNATHASSEYKGNQAGTTYDPGTMSSNTTYYWRIDEFDGSTTKGTVWSFTTIKAPPTFVAAGAVTSNTTAITPALPAGIATNDILLLFLETANQAVTISDQNGGTWTQVTNSPQGTGTAAGTTGARLTAFWSRYNGTQGAPTTSDSGNHQTGRMIAIRGAVASGNPWDVTAGGVEAASDTSGSIPGATTTVTNTLVVTAIAASLPDATGTANLSSWTNANLTSITERTDNTVTAGNGGGLGIATGIRAATGAYGNTAVTLGSSAYKGMMSIAIKP